MKREVPNQQMKKEAMRFFLRNVIEIFVLIILFVHFNNRMPFIFLLPLFVVLLAFFFDFYKIYHFYIEQDLKGLFKFQSNFLFYTFAWYFLPLFVFALFILKDVHGLKPELIFLVFILYTGLYFYNLKASRALKEVYRA